MRRRSRHQTALKTTSHSRLARELGLRLVNVDQLTILRKRHGSGFRFFSAGRKPIRDKAVVARLNRLAVPPAYAEANYCVDPKGHIQAIWRDAVGRLQYRYHPDWEKVREARKLKRLSHLALALPRIRRAVTRHLSSEPATREFALAAITEMVAASGIRAGRESYARLNGTRGAATLLKSNVRVKGATIALSFRAKGGKDFRKEFTSAKLAAAIRRLRGLPGPRLFQYRGASGPASVRARDVNEFLRDVTGTDITLKDLRTLTASKTALKALSRMPPATSERRRKKQIVEAMRHAADALGNTPAVCRKSYVPAPLVSAFEKGRLHKRATVATGGSGEKLLAALAATNA